MSVRLSSAVLDRYERATLYNSPYPAHDRGCAIDLYPGPDSPHARPGTPGSTTDAPSPVAGEVRGVESVDAPGRAYAADRDYLVLVDVEEPASARGMVARIMHVDPGVESGQHIVRGESLGELVRSGYYAPWVDNHVHLGFREPDANLRRATGSVRLALDVDVEPVAWDGTGTVVEAGDTYAVLDAPTHPSPGTWAGIAADDGGVLDGGLPHYEGGGLLAADREGPVALGGDPVGTATLRDVTWDDATVLANGEPVTGLSLFLARDAGFGAKLVDRDADFRAGEDVEVTIRGAD